MNANPNPAARAVQQALEKACGEMIRRLHGLLEPKVKIAPEIHALRKLGKSIRGGLALLGVAKEDVRAVVAVGRLLGAPRDAVSRRTTWRRLGLDDGPLAGDPSVAAVRALLEANVKAAAHRPPHEVVAWAEARIRHARAALKALPVAELPARLDEGRRHLARRLAKRLKRLERENPGSHELHNARKALKAWLGALQHLGETPPEAMVAMADALGDINDLHVLAAWLEAHGFSRDLAPEPWRALEEKLGRLEAAVIAEAPGVRGLLG